MAAPTPPGHSDDSDATPTGRFTAVLIYTDLTGRIREPSKEACGVLGASSPTLAREKLLTLFFVANREQVTEAMHAAAGGIVVPVQAVLQPLKGTRRHVLLCIERPLELRHNTLEWFLTERDPLHRPGVR